MKIFILVMSLILASCSPERPRSTRLAVSDWKGGARTLLRAAGEDVAPGYEIDWRELKSGEALDALFADAVDIAGVGDTALINGRARGLPIKVIAAWRITNENTAVLTRGDSPFRAIGDLRGQKVCVTRGAMEHFLLLRAVEEAKLPENAIGTAFLAASDCRTALDSGAVAAWAASGRYTVSELKQNNARTLVTGSDIVPGFGIVVAKEKTITEKRAAVTDFVSRLRRARTWALGNPEAYARAITEDTGVPYEITLQQVLRDGAQPVSVASLLRPLQEIQRVFVRAGVISVSIDVKDALDVSFDASNDS